MLSIKKYYKSQKFVSINSSNIKKIDKIRESKSQLKLEKFFKMENQIMTSNNSIQLCKLEFIGNVKKGMCYICKKLNPNAEFDNIKTRTGYKRHNLFIYSEHYTKHILDYFEIKEKLLNYLNILN